tara:strand:- start:2607 stop:3227 length:621 start_codon:yes stop_codon:yes gene_type:complete
MDSLIKKIPVFPLNDALLLPTGDLPLNIFEPRYISMVNYALSHNKLIGMIQPKPDNPKAFFKTGCIGKITTYNELEDNKSIICLKGVSRFLIKDEIKHSKNFKIFNVEYIDIKPYFDKLDNKLFNKNIFIEKIKFFFKKRDININLESFYNMNEKSLVITTAMVCPFSASEKQVLLECNDINSLAKTTLSLLDFGINQLYEYETIN